MKHSRLQTILDAYGSQQSKWPEAERHEASLLIESDLAAATMLEQTILLDEQLNLHQVRMPSGLAEKIFHERKKSLIDQIIDWILPIHRANLWHPALAASLPLLFGVAISTTSLGDLIDVEINNNDDYTLTWDSDFYLLPLEDYALEPTLPLKQDND